MFNLFYFLITKWLQVQPLLDFSHCEVQKKLILKKIDIASYRSYKQ